MSGRDEEILIYFIWPHLTTKHIHAKFAVTSTKEAEEAQEEEEEEEEEEGEEPTSLDFWQKSSQKGDHKISCRFLYRPSQLTS